jgi:hypothetical protein
VLHDDAQLAAVFSAHHRAAISVAIQPGRLLGAVVQDQVRAQQPEQHHDERQRDRDGAEENLLAAAQQHQVVRMLEWSDKDACIANRPAGPPLSPA